MLQPEYETSTFTGLHHTYSITVNVEDLCSDLSTASNYKDYNPFKVYKTERASESNNFIA